MLKVLQTLMPKRRRRPVIVEFRNGTTTTEAPSKMDKGNLASKSVTVLMLLLVSALSAPSVCILITMIGPILMAHHGC